MQEGGQPRRRRGAVSAESGMDDAPADGPEPEKVPKDADTIAYLDSVLKNNILFNHLEEKERHTLWDYMTQREYKAGDVIIQQDDPEGDAFYVIDEGQCEVWKDYKDGKEPVMVLVIQPKGFFGELALMYNTPRAATVKAKTDCKLWAIARATFRRYLMESTQQKRKLYDSFLAKVPILVNLDPYERLTIADALSPVFFDDQEVILNQGDSGDSFFIVVEGEVKVIKDGKETHNSPLKSGNYFGEIALLRNVPRQATLSAVGKVKCVCLDRESFNRVMGPCEDILNRNMDTYRHAAEDAGETPIDVAGEDKAESG